MCASGAHFRNSLNVGYDMGKKIAAYLIDNSLKPGALTATPRVTPTMQGLN